MRGYLMFLATAFAMAGAVGFTVDLSAGCRCNKPAKGDRKAARHERKACRRGQSAACVNPATPSYNPYDSGVQPLGQSSASRLGVAGVDEQGRAYRVTAEWTTADGRKVEQRCMGNSCYIAPAPTAAVAPVPDPKFQETVKPPESPAPQAVNQPPTPGDVQQLGASIASGSPIIAEDWYAAETNWRPDPRSLPQGPQSAIPQIDE